MYIIISMISYNSIFFVDNFVSLILFSAGVGRTGTFIGLDSLLKQGRDTGKINVFEFVKQMRGDRMTMVQTPVKILNTINQTECFDCDDIVLLFDKHNACVEYFEGKDMLMSRFYLHCLNLDAAV